jgi:hypothetical protein
MPFTVHVPFSSTLRHPGGRFASTGLGLVAAGAVIDRRRGSGKSAQQKAASAFFVGTEQLGRDVLPVWSAHIENSRSQMEEAVSALAQRSRRPRR